MSTGRWDVNAALAYIELVGWPNALSSLPPTERGEYRRAFADLLEHTRQEIRNLIMYEHPGMDVEEANRYAKREARGQAVTMRAEAFAEAMNLCGRDTKSQQQCR